MRWILTPLAESTYSDVAHVRGDARVELLEALAGAHQVDGARARADGLEVWRGRPPARLRFLVERTADAARVVRVEASHRGAPRGYQQMPHRDRDDAPPLGRQLATWRARRGLDAGELATLAGVTDAELSALETGAAVSWQVVSRVARCLRVRVLVSDTE